MNQATHPQVGSCKSRTSRDAFPAHLLIGLAKNDLNFLFITETHSLMWIGPKESKTGHLLFLHFLSFWPGYLFARETPWEPTKVLGSGPRAK